MGYNQTRSSSHKKSSQSSYQLVNFDYFFKFFFSQSWLNLKKKSVTTDFLKKKIKISVNIFGSYFVDNVKIFSMVRNLLFPFNLINFPFFSFFKLVKIFFYRNFHLNLAIFFEFIFKKLNYDWYFNFFSEKSVVTNFFEIIFKHVSHDLFFYFFSFKKSEVTYFFEIFFKNVNQKWLSHWLVTSGTSLDIIRIYYYF